MGSKTKVRSSTQDYNNMTVYSLYFLGFMDLMSVSMGLPLLARRARELGATPSVVGLIGSVYGATQLFSSPLVGKYSDVKGRKKVLMLCLLGTALGYLCHGLSTSLILMALSRIPTGIFKQSQGLCKACLADVIPSERLAVFGRFNACSSLGFVVGPLIGGHLAMTENGFFLVFLLQSILFVMMCLFTWLFVEHDDRKQLKVSAKERSSDDEEDDGVRKGSDGSGHVTARKGSDGSGHVTAESGPRLQETLNHLADVRRDEKKATDQGVLARIVHFLNIASLGSIADLLLARFLMGFAMIIFRSSLTTILEFRYNTTPRTNGYIMSFNGMVGGLSGMFVGKVLTFYDNDDAKALLHFSVILTSAIFCVTFSPELWVLVAFMAPLAFSSAVSRVCSTNLTLKRGRADEKGALMGVGNSLMSVARMLSPALGGFAQEMSVHGPGVLSVAISGLGILIMATSIVE